MSEVVEHLSKSEQRGISNARRFQSVQAAAARKGAEVQSVGPRVIGAKRGHYGREKTGVEWLREKGKLSAPQAGIGTRYGQWWRGAQLSGAGVIRSCLDDSVPGSGGEGGLPSTDETAAWIADCVAKVEACHTTLGHIDYLVAVVAAVCGKGLTVASITPDQRKQVEIITSLRTALDLLLAEERRQGTL